MTSNWIRTGVAAAAMLGMAAGGSLALARNGSTGAGNTATETQAEPGALTRSTTERSSKLSRRDREFMRTAAHGDLAEVEAGRLAQQKSSNEKVKSFGERMVSDHSSANDKLTSLAQSLDVKLPTEPTSRDKRQIKRLESLSGSKFETAYARDMVRDHRTDIREFEREAKDGTNPEVKQFAQTTLPTLKEHLSLAEQLPGERRSASAARTPAER